VWQSHSPLFFNIIKKKKRREKKRKYSSALIIEYPRNGVKRGQLVSNKRVIHSQALLSHIFSKYQDKTRFSLP